MRVELSQRFLVTFSSCAVQIADNGPSSVGDAYLGWGALYDLHVSDGKVVPDLPHQYAAIGPHIPIALAGKPTSSQHAPAQ